MGMSINEHKEHLLDIMDSMPDDACGDWRDSLAFAINTMRKYQKIERIFKDWCEVGDDGDICAFRNLKQVICPCIGDKDGNDDKTNE